MGTSVTAAAGAGAAGLVAIAGTVLVGLAAGVAFGTWLRKTFPQIDDFVQDKLGFRKFGEWATGVKESEEVASAVGSKFLIKAQKKLGQKFATEKEAMAAWKKTQAELKAEYGQEGGAEALRQMQMGVIDPQVIAKLEQRSSTATTKAVKEGVIQAAKEDVEAGPVKRLFSKMTEVVGSQEELVDTIKEWLMKGEDFIKTKALPAVVEKGRETAASATAAVDRLRSSVAQSDVSDMLVKGRVTPQQVFAYLKEKGLSKEHAMGMLANIKAESGFRPGVLGDQGTSGGLFQHHAGRFSAMRNFAGDDWRTDWKGQIDYALSESDTQKYLGKQFGSGEAASQWFTKYWERPANADMRARQRAQFVTGLEGQVMVPAPGPAPNAATNVTSGSTSSQVASPKTGGPVVVPTPQTEVVAAIREQTNTLVANADKQGRQASVGPDRAGGSRQALRHQMESLNT
jgi:hypothetical protein